MGNLKTPDELGRMTNAAIVKERAAALLICSALSKELIAAGRGHEKCSDTLTKTDPLSMRFRAAHQRASALCIEAEIRTSWGTGAHDSMLLVSPRFRRIKP